MPIIRIGSESEYVSIALPPSYSRDGFAQADVEIAVRCFHGRVSPWIEAADFERFSTQLRAMYDSLQGEAEFSPLDKQFTLKLVCTVGGHVQATGEAWSQATYENKLEYVLELDQSYLLGPLQELEGMLAAPTKSDA